MTPALESLLRSMSEAQMRRHVAESRRALRVAWPHRNTDQRARMVVRSNVVMLRNCRSL